MTDQVKRPFCQLNEKGVGGDVERFKCQPPNKNSDYPYRTCHTPIMVNPGQRSTRYVHSRTRRGSDGRAPTHEYFPNFEHRHSSRNEGVLSLLAPG